MKVCKFGGSSLADSDEYRKVRAIVEKDPERQVIVVSAAGKRFKEDNKVTDLLYLTYQHMKYKVDFHSVFDPVKERYLAIKWELEIPVDIEKDLSLIEEKLKTKSISEEELVSRGEYLSARLMAGYLGYQFIDSKDLIVFDYDGKVNEKKTLENIQRLLPPGSKAVVPGFYGSYPNGKICLFSRGGSDVSASYLAKGTGADLYENWTDVSGFYMADPSIVKNPRRIREISYLELRELSYMGANVIHEETILPLQDKAIPLEILNTNAPEEGGTLIKKETSDKSHLITGITGRQGYLSLTFVKKKASDKLEALLKVLKVFEEFSVPVEHIPTSIDSFSVIVEKSKAEGKIYDILSAIRSIDEITSVSEDDDIALVAVVGKNMAKKPGTSGRILSVFGEKKINIKLIDQGDEEINIIIGVNNADFAPSVRALYESFFKESV